jgi:8-oxo-dGTP pyrophosphatase MutT (NUDIX family)
MHWVFPLETERKIKPDLAGCFGIKRKYDVHTGIDLYCELGTNVLAAEDGIVVSISWFTGEKSSDKTGWWNNTQSVMIAGKTGVILYGEMSPIVSFGDSVKAGQVIGTVTTPVLKKFKNRPMVMLHLELYKHGQKNYVGWDLGQKNPDCLLDPTPYLYFNENFDISEYNNIDFRAVTSKEDIEIKCINSSVVILNDSGKILMLERHNTDPLFTGFCFPGGKVDINESEYDCAIRETFEETGVRVDDLKVWSYKFISKTKKDGVPFLINVFEADFSNYSDAKLALCYRYPTREHLSYRMVSPGEELNFSGFWTKKIINIFNANNFRENNGELK